MTENFFQKAHPKMEAGLGLIVLGSIFTGIFHLGVLYLFGIPLVAVLIGITLVWLSRSKIKTKIIWTFMPLLIIPTIFYSLIQIRKADPETFLIPQGYRGEIAVLHDEKCGRAPRVENGRKVYDFTVNNIIITDSARREGFLDQKFYLVDENGRRTELGRFHWSEYEKEMRDWHWLFTGSKPTKETVGVFWGYANYAAYIVSDYRTEENRDQKEKEAEQKQFRNKLDAMLKECRGRVF